MARSGSSRLEVRHYHELLRAFRKAGTETKRELEGALRKVGNIVRDDARRKLGSFRAGPASRPTITGLRTVVRARGVSVEQTRRRTTGLRPDWGATQMRLGLVPARDESQPEVIREFDRVLDHVSRDFND